MCGGNYGDKPKQLIEIMGEKIIARTIRLLKAYGVNPLDIFISSNDERFRGWGVRVLRHDNDFMYGKNEHKWLKAFYPMDEPVTYIFGDVYFSERAIKTIIETPVESIMFFASAPPFSTMYMKDWAEPFAFKVMDTKLFFEKVEECHRYDLDKKFHREAISWELWQVIKGTKLDEIDYTNYVAINDYTCDVDNAEEAREIERRVWGR